MATYNIVTESVSFQSASGGVMSIMKGEVLTDEQVAARATAAGFTLEELQAGLAKIKPNRWGVIADVDFSAVADGYKFVPKMIMGEVVRITESDDNNEEG